jgi:hypothetical protein
MNTLNLIKHKFEQMKHPIPNKIQKIMISNNLIGYN